MPNNEYMRWLSVDSLRFDGKTPRLAEYGIGEASGEEDIISLLWDAMDIGELVQSIAASGYFPHEPLVVVENNGENIVIEGNRRLAAVKALLDPVLSEKRGWNVPKLGKKALSNLESLPARISPGRKDSWRYLGFKHVNGPAKWTSYAKAKYIADVHREYGVSLEDISRQIGDGHKTVQRLYRGLAVLEQAEREKVYDRENRFYMRFSFSHLYIGLGYDGITGFLSLESSDPENPDPVPGDRITELGELCVWLYGDRKREIPPVVKSQNPHLRQLDEVLKSKEAVAALRAGNELSLALDLGRPPAAVLEESLRNAKRELQRARDYMATGYNGSGELLIAVGTTTDLAYDIHHREMEIRKSAPG